MLIPDEDQGLGAQSPPETPPEGGGEGEDQGTPPVKPGEGGEGEPSSQPVEIDGKKYTTEELKGLLEKAGQYDSLQPEYTKVTQDLAKLERTEKERIEKEGRTVEQKDLDSAADKAFELLAPRIEKLFIKLQSKEGQSRDLNARMKELEKEIDGKDGRPKFVPADVIKYAADNDLGGDPLDIYEKMFREVLRDFYRKQGIQAKPKPIFSEKSGVGVHLPKGKDLTKMSKEDFKKAAVDFLGSLGS